MKYLDELRGLNLPKDKFAVFGSGTLAIRELRENKDLDVIVKRDLFEELSKKYPVVNVEKGGSIETGHMEIWANLEPWFSDIIPMIDDADIIEGIRFVKLKYVLAWKKMRNSDRDKEDIKLIESYLKNSNL
jgi:hypothetical protein